MNVSTLLSDLINGYKANSPAILAIVSGIGMILTKNYSGGISDILQALTLIFGGTTVVGLSNAVAKLSAGAQAGPVQPVVDDARPAVKAD
jgi:hypothetical protein